MKSYGDFIFVDKQIHSKLGGFTIEIYNSRVRHYLGVFNRKTKYYSKSNYMVEVSLNLLMLKLNNELHILNEQWQIKI